MRKNTSPNISQLISSLFPDHVSANYPRLIEFAKAFFTYLETENKSSYYQNTLYKQRNVLEQDDIFLSYIKKELGIFTKKSYVADPKLFYDYISTLWKTKGSEQAVKTFFKLFLDDDVTVYYPWESVLIASDGRWTIDTVIRVSIISGNANDFSGKAIKQFGSTGTAIISDVVRNVYEDGDIYDLYITASSGEFLDHGIIYVEGNDDLRAEAYRSVTSINILNAGEGYSVGDKITIDGYEGNSFIAYVSFVDKNGGIVEIKIIDFGAGNTPTHIVDGENPPLYYFKDFAIYKNLKILQSSVYNDYLLNVKKDSITVYEFDEKLRLLNGIVGSLNNDYTETTSLYFAEDYIGDSAFNDQSFIGSTQTIQNYNGFIGPNQLPFVIKSKTGSGAKLSLNFGIVTQYPGYYKGIKGQLSEDIVLQDSEYYQKYSYEITSKYASKNWDDSFKKITHPAGIAVFNKIKSYNKEFTGIDNSYVFLREKDPPSQTITETPLIKENVVGVIQNYVYNNDTELNFSNDVYFAEDYVGEIKFSEESIVGNQNTNFTFNDAVFSELS